MSAWRRFRSDPLAVCGVLALLAVVVVLCWPGATSHEDDFTFQDWAFSGPTTTFDLTPSPTDITLLTAALTVDDMPRLAEAVRLSFLFATYGDVATLEWARLRVPGRPLCFTTSPGAELKNNELLVFEPTPSCAPALAEGQKAVLEVKLRGPARVTLWSHMATTFARIRLLSGDARGSTILPIGRIQLPKGPALSIGQLLKVTWARIGAETWGGLTSLSWTLLSAALCFIAGVFLTQRSEAKGKHPYWGLLALCLGLSLCYAILIPPFQIADEPDHILTWAQSAGKPALADDSLKLAQDTHFERIKFRPDQKFASRDVGQSLKVPFMPDIYAIDLVTRSIGQRTFWAFLTKHWTITDAAAEVLKFRLLAAALIFTTLSILFLSAAAVRQSPYPLFFMVLHAPFVVFITTTPGNYLLIGVGGILVAGALGLTLGGRTLLEALASSITAGFGTALCLAAGSTGLFVPAFWLAYLPFLLIADASDAATRRRFWLFWPVRILGLAAGFYPVFKWIEGAGIGPFLDPLFHAGLTKTFTEVGPQIPLWMPIGIGALSVLVGIALALRPKLVGWLRVPFVIALAWVVFFPLVRHLREVPSIEYVSNKPLAPDYVRTVIRAFFTSLMPTSRMDGLVGQSFWSGFGWLDVHLPGWQTGWQRFGAAGLLIWGLLRKDWTKRGADSFVWLGGLVSLILLLGVTAYGYWTRSYNIHGRYLVVCYLVLLALVFGQFRSGSRLFRFAACGLVLLHGGVLTSMLFRYFA